MLESDRQADRQTTTKKKRNKVRDTETEKLYIPQGLNLGNFSLSVEHSKHNIQTEENKAKIEA